MKITKAITLELEVLNKLIEYSSKNKVAASHLIQKLLINFFNDSKNTIVLESNRITPELKNQKYKELLLEVENIRQGKNYYLNAESSFFVDTLAIQKNIKKTSIINLAIKLLFEDMKKNGEIDFEFPFEFAKKYKNISN